MLDARRQLRADPRQGGRGGGHGRAVHRCGLAPDLFGLHARQPRSNGHRQRRLRPRARVLPRAAVRAQSQRLLRRGRRGQDMVLGGVRVMGRVEIRPQLWETRALRLVHQRVPAERHLAPHCGRQRPSVRLVDVAAVHGAIERRRRGLLRVLRRGGGGKSRGVRRRDRRPARVRRPLPRLRRPQPERRSAGQAVQALARGQQRRRLPDRHAPFGDEHGRADRQAPAVSRDDRHARGGVRQFRRGRQTEQGEVRLFRTQKRREPRRRRGRPTARKW